MHNCVFIEFILEFLIVKKLIVSSFQFFVEQWFYLVDKYCYKSREREKALNQGFPKTGFLSVLVRESRPKMQKIKFKFSSSEEQRHFTLGPSAVVVKRLLKIFIYFIFLGSRKIENIPALKFLSKAEMTLKWSRSSMWWSSTSWFESL